MATALAQGPWHLAAEQMNDSTVFCFNGQKTSTDTGERVVIGPQLATLLDSSTKANVSLDFDNVEYLYSTDLAKLIGIWKKLNNASRRLILFNVKPEVYEVFHVTQLTKLMEIHEAGDDLY